MEAVSALSQNVILVTHALDLLEPLDRVLVFHEGRLVADAPPAKAVAAYEDLIP